MTQNLEDLQADMRHAYVGGGTGLLASAMAWLAAAIVALRSTPDAAMWTLLVCGVAIHPMGVLLSRLFGRSGAHRKGNPLGLLAGASTVWLIAGLLLAYVASRLHAEWFFPAVLLVIGSRFLAFETVYGLRAYLVCGAVLLAAGIGLGGAMVEPALAAFAGAVIEAAFGISILLRERRTPNTVPSAA